MDETSYKNEEKTETFSANKTLI